MSPPPRVSIIAAVANNGVIGHQGRIPWHLPRDLRHFQKVTAWRPIIMGRKTFEGLGYLLPFRLNIVISHHEAPISHRGSPARNSYHSTLENKGFKQVVSLEEALKVAKSHLENPLSPWGGETLIIGGAQIYAQGMSIATRMYLTRVDADPEGDTFFPPIGPEWVLKSGEHHPKDEANEFAMTFQVWEKNT